MIQYEYKTNTFIIKKVKSEFNSIKVQSSKDAADYARNFYFDDMLIYESFFILCLNRNNNTTAWVKISQGGVSGTVVDVKLISKYAIESLSSSVILIHNHPSGNKNPSESDKNITRKVKDTLSLFDCQLTDHIILTETDYTSFCDEGIL